MQFYQKNLIEKDLNIEVYVKHLIETANDLMSTFHNYEWALEIF